MPTFHLYAALELPEFGAATMPKSGLATKPPHLAQGRNDDICFSESGLEELISLMSVCEISF